MSWSLSLSTFFRLSFTARMLIVPLLASLQHAYYLDHKVSKHHSLTFLSPPWDLYLMILGHFSQQNDKGKYVNVFMNHLVSWNVAMARMARAEAFVNLGEPKIPIAWDVFRPRICSRVASLCLPRYFRLELGGVPWLQSYSLHVLAQKGLMIFVKLLLYHQWLVAQKTSFSVFHHGWWQS